MANLFEYMQFSLGVYAASAKNYIDPPLGWTRTDWQPDKSSGFSARESKGSASHLISPGHHATPTTHQSDRQGSGKRQRG